MQNYATWIHGCFIIYIKTEGFYKDIANNVEKRFDKSEYKVNRPLPMDKNHKVTGIMQDELGGKITTEFAGLRPKTYSYLMNDGNSVRKAKKAKGTKKCVIKKYLNLAIINIAY